MNQQTSTKSWPTLSLDSITLQLDPATKYHPIRANLRVFFRALRYILSAIATVVAIAVLIFQILETESGNPLVWFWSPGSVTFILGIAIIACTLSITWAWYRQATLSLTNLYEETKLKHTQLERYLSPSIRHVLEKAASYVQGSEQSEVQVHHLLTALLDNPRIQLIIERAEVNLRSLLETVASSQPDTLTSQHSTPRYLSTDVADIVTTAIQIAYSSNTPTVQVEHLLAAWFEVCTGPLSEQVSQLGLTKPLLLRLINWYRSDEILSQRYNTWRLHAANRPASSMNRAWTAKPTPILDSVSEDLTLQVSQGLLSQTAGREQELQLITRLLSTESRQSALLIGEHDELPERVIYTLAAQMVSDDVPETLRDKRLVRIDIASVLTTSESAEELLSEILREVTEAGNIVLVIPNVQQLITVGSNFDSGSVLAASIERGRISILTTATYAEYHRYVEQNLGLSALLRIVELHTLSESEVIAAAEIDVPNLESTHDVSITLPAIERAYQLSNQYISHRKQPGVTIDLLRESAASAASQNSDWVRRSNVDQALQSMTTIPVAEATATEAQQLLNLEETLSQKVLGQPHAVNLVASAVRRARTGLTSPKRPIASFLFVGPTGVGKTELAKALASQYFGPNRPTIRFDMSEYQDGKAVYTLIGAPAEANTSSLPEGGTLTKAVREHPHSLIIFDELEKAHRDVRTILLQILEDARVTENTGRVVSFTSCIIIATSNAQAAEIGELLRHPDYASNSDNATIRILESTFPPELLNRFDAIVPFTPLSVETLQIIAQKMVAELSSRVSSKDITLLVPPETIAVLVQQGSDDRYGARPLRRIIEQKLESIVATLMLSGSAKKGDTITITPSMVQ